MNGEEYLGRLIVARTGPGSLQAVGKCVGYADHPTMIIETSDGQRIHWAAHLCKVVDLPDDAATAIISGWTGDGGSGKK